jgi:tetratricopeptide (TPR) repeat protein
MAQQVSEAPLNIKLRCTSWQQLANIHRRDLTRNAIFLRTATPPPVGTNVRIDLNVPTGASIVLIGTVAEHIAEGGLGGRGPGIDIMLHEIPQSTMSWIETAIASAQSGAQHVPDAAQAPLPEPKRATVATASEEPRPHAATGAVDDGRGDLSRANLLVDAGQYDEAISLYGRFVRRPETDRSARAGIELAEGLKALNQRDRLEAAQRFEAVLEIDPTNERAARELAEMRRLATNERKGLLSRLMGKKE